MSTLEDQLRAVMANRAGRQPQPADPYEGVHRLIRRTRRRRAAAGAAGLAAVAFVGVAVALPGSGDRGQPAKPGGLLLATIAPGSFGPDDGNVSVPVPADGLTFVVDCRGANEPLVIRVGGRWFTGFDCGSGAAKVATSFALRPGDYQRFGLRVGSRATVEVSDTDPYALSATKHNWRVRVEAGLPRAAAPVIPEATRLPARRFTGVITSLKASTGSPNGERQVSFTAPPDGVDLHIECLYPSQLDIEVIDAAGNAFASVANPCRTFVADKGVVTVQITRDELAMQPRSRRLTMRVSAGGFQRPLWRVTVTTPQPGSRP